MTTRVRITTTGTVPEMMAAIAEKVERRIGVSPGDRLGFTFTVDEANAIAAALRIAECIAILDRTSALDRLDLPAMARLERQWEKAREGLRDS